MEVVGDLKYKVFFVSFFVTRVRPYLRRGSILKMTDRPNFELNILG